MADVKLNPNHPYSEDIYEGYNFVPGRKDGKVSVSGLRQALFDMGNSDNLYVVLLRIPEEYPEDSGEEEVVGAWDAMKMLAAYNHCKLIDQFGDEVE